jgi:hypothetical protein|tara:strand:- start:165 stop:830 length:666 start_codon:yes stop_codon:yes gene_type:complete
MKIIFSLIKFVLCLFFVSLIGWGIFYITDGTKTIEQMNGLLALMNDGSIQDKNSEFLKGACSQRNLLDCYHIYWYVDFLFLAIPLSVALWILSIILGKSNSNKQINAQDKSKVQATTQGVNIPFISRKHIILLIIGWFILNILFLKTHEALPSVLTVLIALFLFFILVLFGYFAFYDDKHFKGDKSSMTDHFNMVINKAKFQKDILLIMIPLSIWVVVNFW